MTAKRQTEKNEIERLISKRIALLEAGVAQGRGVLGIGWTFVTASATVGLGASKIGVLGAGVVTLTLPALSTLPNLWTLIVTAQGNPNPITVKPPTGTIWDPSTSAFAATAVLVNGAGGANGWWQFDQPNNRFIEIV